MSELVKQGIEQAQSDLRKESDEAIWNEGLLRHVPLVGSIYNWISPAQKVSILVYFFPYFINFLKFNLDANQGKNSTTE